MKEIKEKLEFTTRLKEECGIFAIYNHTDAATLTTLGLHSLQHRGQEAVGIVTFDENQFHSEKFIGLVGDNFSDPKTIERLKGKNAIGHVRYSTTGDTITRNIQPLFADIGTGGLSLAHNGNLTNAVTLRKELVKNGSIFQSTTDTETIVHLIATSAYKKFIDRFIDALKKVEGAYSLVALTNEQLIAARDPYGVRPLVMGTLNNSTVFASETVALDIIGAKFERDVLPGEIVIVDKNKTTSLMPFLQKKPKFCIFEYVYFARPDSILEKLNVYGVRKKIGAELAKESHVDADLVVAVPDSGTPAAIGYANQINLPFELGIIRNHYIGRTFIEPTQKIRHLGVKLKHNANNFEIKNKRVILIDDSIVRGTTSKKIVEMIKSSGAKEVHMRIASPPTKNSCFYGVDTPEKKDLMAANNDVEQIRKIIGADTLSFISMDGLYRAIIKTNRDNKEPQYCDACFSSKYPINILDYNGERKTSQLSLLREFSEKNKKYGA